MIFISILKNRIRVMLFGLPLGLGSDFIIPTIKWILFPFSYISINIIDKIYKSRLIKSELKFINEAMRNNISQVTIAYDNYVSPPTYGDFLYVILLARYFIALGKKVNFIIVDGEYRNDWYKRYTDVNEYVTQQINLSNALLNSPFIKIEKLSWKNFNEKFFNDEKNIFIPFSRNVKNRLSIYNNCFDLLNKLLDDKSQELVNKVLFSFEELIKKIEVLPVQFSYVSWICRYSLEEGNSGSNTTDEEFISIHSHLCQRFPHCLIMIVSDTNGCQYFSKLAQENNLNCIFSKQYSKTFLGDGALILNSEFLLQVRGGGIGIFPIFSRMPYEITTPLIHERMWNKSKLTSFQSPMQLFTNGRERT